MNEKTSQREEREKRDYPKMIDKIRQATEELRQALEEDPRMTEPARQAELYAFPYHIMVPGIQTSREIWEQAEQNGLVREAELAMARRYLEEQRPDVARRAMCAIFADRILEEEEREQKFISTKEARRRQEEQEMVLAVGKTKEMADEGPKVYVSRTWQAEGGPDPETGLYPGQGQKIKDRRLLTFEDVKRQE